MNRTMWFLGRLLPVVVFVAIGAFIPSPVLAGIAFTGDYSPDPASWNSSTDGYVGNTAAGTVTVTSGGTLSSQNGYIGYTSTGTGTATVDGIGSTWNSDSLFVGCSGSEWTLVSLFPTPAAGGNGTLNISNGGGVVVFGTTYLGYNPGSIGTINFGGSGGTLTTQGLWASMTQLTGAGTINTNGLVSDVNLVFDSPASKIQTLTLNQPGQNITVNLDMSNPNNVGDLGTGYIGSGMLIIHNGATVYSSSGCLGFQAGSTGTAMVDGTGSRWSIDSGPLYVGVSGQAALNITNGGAVTSGTTYVGGQLGATGVATVDGAGSKWTNSDVYVGYSGSGALNITNGGAVTSAATIVGYQLGATGVVTVDGSGSTWTDRSLLCVGGSGNGTLNITNGGAVTSAGATCVGCNTGSTGTINFGPGGGTLTTQGLYASPTQLTGTGTINTNGLVSDGNLVFDSTHGLNQTVPGFGSVTVNLNMSNFNNVGDLGAGYLGSGSLTIRNGIAVNCATGYLGYNAGSTGVATVDGVGSSWTNSGVYVGYSGNGTLNITNGGAVNTVNYGGVIGNQAGSVGAATVDGTGSNWNCFSGLTVGYSGIGTLNITNGGTVNTVNYGGVIGNRAGSVGAATVDGTGSNWNCLSGLTVGYSGIGTLNITNGGRVAGGGDIGEQYGSTGIVTVDGAGSMWTSNGNVLVGCSPSNAEGLPYVPTLVPVAGGNGMLNISNGGAVAVAGTTYLGYNPGSIGTINFGGNGGTLTTNGLWALPTQLTGTGTINTNGLVSDVNLVFDSPASTKQSFALNQPGQNIAVNLDMSNSSNVGDLGVGYIGSGSLAIRNGATVNSASGYLGIQAGSTGTATVDGTGSSWVNSSPLYVGFSGQAALSITNGGYVSAPGGGSGILIGFNSGSTGVVTVDGTGSTCASNSNLFVGFSGNGTLNITNGGFVGLTGANQNQGCYIGGYICNPGSFMGGVGVATVDGAGSALTSNSGLFVGISGTGTLNITNGGHVSAASTRIGGGAGLVGIVTVDGPGSTLAATTGTNGALYVDGTLNITNGATVSDAGAAGLHYAWIGYDSPGATGAVTVAGPGSTWNCPNSYVFVGGGIGGHGGTGSLSILNGATVTSAFATIAPGGVGAGTATVDGPGSTWTDTGNLFVTNGALRITNGGAVNLTATSGLGINVGNNGNNSVPITGILAVDGTGSTLSTLCTGESLSVAGDGILRITNGGLATDAGIALIGGQGASSPAAVIVDGAGSRWASAGGIRVGYNLIFPTTYFPGTLNITNGGTVQGGNDQITAVGTVTVDGRGSTWSNGNGSPFAVSGMLNITNGGAVSSGGATIDNSATSSAVVTVDGVGSTWTSNWLGVGGSGTGVLNITNGGTVVGGIACGWNPGSAGTINFNGGILKSNAGSMYWIAAGFGSANVYVKEGGALFDTGGFAMGIPIALQHGGSNPIDGGVTKLGAGTLTLSGANTYTGLTTVSAGVLDFDGPSAWNPVTNLGGAYLSGGELVFDYTGGADPYATILGLLKAQINGSMPLTVVDNTVSDTVTVSLAVPEPGTLILLASGLLAVLAYLWRKRR